MFLWCGTTVSNNTIRMNIYVEVSTAPIIIYKWHSSGCFCRNGLNKFFLRSVTYPRETDLYGSKQ